MKVKNSTHKILDTILIVAFIWLLTTTLIQSFACPKMTNTEVFLYIPKSIVCNWQCK